MKKKAWISSESLLARYLTPEIGHYFKKKCPLQSEEVLYLRLSELLKYLSLAHNTLIDVPVSHEIDDLWHFWILQTRQYQELMAKLPSGAFMHHSSKDYPKAVSFQEEEVIEQQLSFLASYLENFGPFNEQTVVYWPMAQQLCGSLGSLEALNEFLDSLSE